MNPVTRTVVTWMGIALLVAVILIYANHYKVLAAENQGKASQLQEKLRSTEQQLAGQSKVLAAYREQSQKNAELAAEQQSVVASLSNEATVRRQRVRQLESENEQIKRWADTLLPDGVARMRVRRAITGAKAYYQWLSEGNSVRSAGSQPTGQQGSELQH
jgi:LysB family phage lysis regulatory protein